MSEKILNTYQAKLEKLRVELEKLIPTDSLAVFDEDAAQLEQHIEGRLKVEKGDRAPDFTLTNAIDDSVNLYQQLKQNKVVLVFYRGSWCPYCNLVLQHYQAHLAEFEKLGAKLIAISPQTPDESLSIQEKNNLGFEVLSDNGNLVGNLYTIVFKNGEAPLQEMEKLGFDFDSFYGNDSKEIPLPAIFVIDQNASILLAKTEGGDYRNRTEVIDIINALKN